MSRLISVVIKPTLACRMDCRHCYHSPAERADERRISFETLDRVFALAAQDYDSAWFVWHGGEPLSLPLSFYKKAIALQEQHFGTASHRVGNTIQTNGLAIDRALLSFCKEKQINLGVSYEGPCDALLRPDGAQVERTLRGMSAGERVFSVSATVARGAQDRQQELYEYFRELGTAVTLAPVIPAGEAAAHPELVPDPAAYAAASIRAFDAWLTDAETKVPLIPHYLYVLAALGDAQPADCAHTSCLTRWLCVYPNGDLYPCAKACPAAFRLGNVQDFGSFAEAFRTPGFAALLAGTVARREKCQSCPVFAYCAGGCSMDACYERGLTENGGASCQVYRAVFTHVKETLDRIIAEKQDLRQYNVFVRDAILGKLLNPVLTTGY